VTCLALRARGTWNADASGLAFDDGAAAAFCSTTRRCYLTHLRLAPPLLSSIYLPAGGGRAILATSPALQNSMPSAAVRILLFLYKRIPSTCGRADWDVARVSLF